MPLGLEILLTYQLMAYRLYVYAELLSRNHGFI